MLRNGNNALFHTFIDLSWLNTTTFIMYFFLKKSANK